jgi:hypothetical protein
MSFSFFITLALGLDLGMVVVLVRPGFVSPLRLSLERRLHGNPKKCRFPKNLHFYLINNIERSALSVVRRPSTHHEQKWGLLPPILTKNILKNRGLFLRITDRYS